MISPSRLQTAHLPHHVCPGLLSHDLTRDSLYRTLRDAYHLTLASAETTVCARLANDEECDLLQLTPPSPLLCTEQITFSDDKRAVEWTVSAFQADRYELSISR